MLSSVCAVIPTFRPERESLTRLVNALTRQMPVLISDDGSQCTTDALLRGFVSENVTVERHRDNVGIARGLNDGLRFARSMGAVWLFTFDQDTQVEDSYLEAMRRTVDGVTNSAIGAIGAERITLVNGEVTYPISGQIDAYPTTEEIIQTGTAWNTVAMTEIGGFDERLGIDAVDAAACLRLRERGRSVAIVPGTVLAHRLGESRTVQVMGRTVVVTGHSPARRTSMLRNRLSLFPAEFRVSPRHALRTVRRVVVNQSLGLILEGDRWAKVRGSVRGVTSRGRDNLGP